MKALISSGLAVVAAIVQSTCAEPQWETDFAKAKAIAAEKNVPILADFSGSDWCGWCIKLDKEVFSTQPFKQYAENNLVLLLVDMPRSKPQSETQKKQNGAMMERYDVQGFPTVILMDATGKELARTGYQRGGPAKYIEHVKALLKK